MATQKLTGKQKRFCQEYLKDLNATAAYIRAGYAVNPDTRTASVNASKLLTNTNIQAYIQQLRDRAASRSEITLEKTLQEIARIAFADITTALSFDADGVHFKNSSELPQAVTAAISSVSSTETQKTFRGETETKITYKMQMHGKVPALTLLADFFGVRDDFNKARATLKRYGLALEQDPESDLGWRLDRVSDSSNPTTESPNDDLLSEIEDDIDEDEEA